jgi:hypothetical protein
VVKQVGSTIPAISVVIPVRDGAGHVSRAIRSAAQQTREDLEIVVVENGSRDHTVELIQREIAADPRIRLVQMDARGVSAARNRGIDEAKGTWIAFLDADDVWRSDKLERQLAGDEADLRFANCRFVVRQRMTNVTFWQVSRPPHSLAGSAEQLLRLLVVGNNPIALSTTVVRRTLLLEAGGFAEQMTHAEDWHLWLRLLLRGASWARTDAVVSEYHIRAAAASRDLATMVAGELEALTLLQNELVAAGLGEPLRQRRDRLLTAHVVLRRQPDATLDSRLRDLLRLIRLGPSARSLAIQVGYTLAPRWATSGRRSAERHDLPALIRQLDRESSDGESSDGGSSPAIR